MELFATVHVAFITSLLFSVLKLITCQDQVQTPSTVFVTEGEIANIYCRFDSSNLVVLDWKRGEDVNSAVSLIKLFKTRTFRGNDARVDITSDSSLTINETTQADSGVYWCQVTLQGVFESSTNLTVLPVTTTPGREPSINTVKPTKSDPKKQTSNNNMLYIIVGCCSGLVLLAIAVLVCYCCCCKSKSPNGYSKPNPNTPV